MLAATALLHSGFTDRISFKMARSLLLALIAPCVHALLRFSCSELVAERLDPLVNPGVAQSPHVHQSRWFREGLQIHRLTIHVCSHRWREFMYYLQVLLLILQECVQYLHGPCSGAFGPGYVHDVHIRGRLQVSGV
jgi:hypothetical protein